MRGLRALALVVALVSSVAVGAQQRRQGGERPHMPSREQIKTQKRAYMARELQLSDKEVDKLMVIINELDDQRFALWRSVEPTRHKLRRGDTLSTEEYAQHFDKTMNNRVREAELERDYYGRCKSILSMDKLIKLERINREFARSFFLKKHKN